MSFSIIQYIWLKQKHSGKKSLNVKLSTITDFPTQKLINIIYQSPTEMPAPINRWFMQRRRISFIVIVLPLLTLWDSIRIWLCINPTRSCLGLVVPDDIRSTRSWRKCCSDGIFRLSGLFPLQESLVEQQSRTKQWFTTFYNLWTLLNCKRLRRCGEDLWPSLCSTRLAEGPSCWNLINWSR